jgi:hypothetical protein
MNNLAKVIIKHPKIKPLIFVDNDLVYPNTHIKYTQQDIRHIKVTYVLQLWIDLICDKTKIIKKLMEHYKESKTKATERFNKMVKNKEIRKWICIWLGGK